MIRPAQAILTDQYTADFGDVPHLAIFRQAPFRFSLLSPSSIRSPHLVFINDDYSKDGSIALIEYIKTLAIAQDETWKDDQLAQAASARTIFIVYNEFNDIKLDYSTEVLTKEDIEQRYEHVMVWVSNEISDTGLINLVDELLKWMRE